MIKANNKSGIVPVGDRVLVQVEKVEEKAGSIILPEKYRDKQEMAQLVATVLENGEIANRELDVWPDQGDKVLITKYAGLLYTGKDGEEYRLVNTDDIVGIFSDE